MMTYQEIWLASLKATKHGREDGLTPAEVFECAERRGEDWHGRPDLSKKVIADYPSRMAKKGLLVPVEGERGRPVCRLDSCRDCQPGRGAWSSSGSFERLVMPLIRSGL